MAFSASSLETRSADLIKVSPIGELSQGLQVQSPIASSSTPSSLVFVDSGVVDASSLLAHSAPGTEVVYLNAIEDAVTQITRTLLNYSGVSSLHILSHGTSGGLTFAQGSLTAENLGQYTNQIKSWSQALSTDADILLYGCDVAGGVAGAAFIRQLGQLSQADIAASTNITGAGGDWILEATTGTIESALISDVTGRSQYRYSLDSPVQLLSNSNALLASSAAGGDLGDRSVSADGKFVVFTSAASTLIPDDINGKKDVFLYDRNLNTITLISHVTGAPGQPSNGDSTSASISADGNFVIFNSTGNNLTADGKTGGANDLFRWNRSNGAIDLISKVSTATGNGDTVNAVISGDGSTIAFISTAKNLTGAIADNNNAADLFRWTAGQGVTLIDIDNDGAIADLGVGDNLDISNNGRFIAFNSRSKMNDSDRNVFLNDIYVYDGTAQTLELVSTGNGSNNATTSVAPRVRYDAATNILRVLFSSEDRLTANDASFSEDIYVAEKDVTDINNNYALRLVSRTAGGTNGNNSSSGAVFSGDGRYVAFTSKATNLVAGDTNNIQDVFLHDLDANPTTATRLISRNSMGGALGDGDSKNIAINDDGSVVAFTSTAKNLVDGNIANDLNAQGEDVFAYDRGNDTLTLVTRKAGATVSATLPSGGGPFGGRSLSRPVVAGTGTGKTIIYANDAIDLVTGDSNDITDIFAFDLTTPANTLLTKVQISQNSSTGAGNSTLQSTGSVSRDGRYAVFTSVVNSLVAKDGNAAADIFIRDTTLAIADPSALKLVSRTVAGASGNQVSSQPFISADGKYVVFTSAASDLVATDTNTQQDVFLYDVTAGTVSLVSKISTAQGDGASGNASVAVDAGGEVYVTFVSRSGNLGASGTGINNVFVWKKSTGAIALVSKSSPTAGGNLESSTPIISADGKYIAFTSNSTNLTTTNFAGTDNNSSADVFIYDITAATLNLVSQNAGIIGNNASFNPVISDTNGIVAFESRASNLTAIVDSNGVSDIFRYDGTSNSLISVNATGNAAGNGLSTGASISADGNTIAFTSEATNLSDTTDNNTKSDVFVRTLTGTAKTTLISRSNLSNTASNGQSDSAALSADGQLVAFISTSTDLSTQDSSPTKDVFTSTITTPSAKLISASTTGSPNGDSSALSLSRDGGVVVFESNASNLIALDDNNASDIFSRTTRATVSLKVLDAAASEGTTDTGAYEISRTDSSGSLDVKLKLSDLLPLTDATIDDVSFTADMGATVTVAAGIITVKIPDGIAKVTLTLTAIVDLLTEGSENAILNLQADGAYTIDPINATGTVVIAPSGTLVTNALDSGVGSLRQAIANARLTPGADTITFALTNPALKTITLLTALDDLNGNITLDGGTSGVILNGASAATGTNGLSITGSGNVVTGITITGFTGNGILIDGSDNTVGGTIAGSGNTVNANKLGVYVKSGTGNQILGNAITNNTDLGIDVEPIGIVTTDPLTLTTALATTTGATVTGTLTGAPGIYRIEFFSNTTTDTVGRTEGEVYLGFQDVTIAAGANTGTVSYSSTATGLANKYISATVTDAAKNTSEFVKDLLVITPLPTVNLSSAEAATGLAEGNTGTTAYKFNLQLSKVVIANTVFNYRTVAVTGAAGAIAGTDYTAVTTGSVTVLAGSDTAIITIDVKGDTRFEVDKSFEVELFGIDSTLYASGTIKATGIIKNDDLRPTISFESNAVSIAEGQTAPNPQLPFKINLSNESDEAITVTYQTIDGLGATGATSTGANPDFTAVSPTVVTFAPGEVSKTVNVEIIADTIDEPAETFSLSLSAPINANFATGSSLEAVGTILPDELPSVGLTSAEDVTGIAEGNTGTTGYKFNLKLSAPVTANTTFNYRTVTVTGAAGAIAGTDYTAVTTGSVTVLAGSDTAVITIDVKGDTRFEVDKSFEVELFGIDSALYASGIIKATGIIKNDDLRPTISFESNAVSIAEGQTAPNSQLPFKINLSNESDEAITVTYQTIDGLGATGATSIGANPDFIAVSPTVITFAPGEISKTVNVEIIADTIDEPAETFSLSLSAPTNATFATGSPLEAVGTILPDEQPYVFSVVAANPTILEGATGANNIAQFTVTLDRDPQEDLIINYATNSGLAVSGTDFVGNTGILTFLKGGGRSQTINVTIIGNNTFQGDRDFQLLLLEPSDRVSIDPTKASATTLIKEDDLPTLSFKVGSSGDIRGVEGSPGSNGSASVVVELSEVSNQDVTVEFTTLDGTATVANNDYKPRTTPGQKITILAGQKTASVNFELIGDDVIEPDETFFVKLSNPIGATILGSDTQTVIIEDDDARLANQPQISINAINATQTEGNTGTKDFTFSVTLNKAPEAGKPVSVTVATTDGIGSNGATVSDNDYIAKTQVITFNPGDPLTQQFTVKVNGDSKLENTETFGIILRNAVNGILGTQSAIATITDDDTPVGIKPVVSIAPITLIQNEGNAGTTPFTFRVTLDKAPDLGETVSVDVATIDGTAISGGGTAGSADFTAKTQTFTFTSTGALTQDFTVLVNGDTQIEANEGFTVELRNAIGATLGSNVIAAATIRDDDTPIATQPRISVSPMTLAQNEGNTGTTPLTFRITLDKAPETGSQVSVDVTTVDGAGSTGAISTGSNADFIAKTQTFTFTSTGALTQDFTVLVNGDTQVESNETFTVELRNAIGGILETTRLVANINNDDGTSPGTRNNISTDSLNDILWRNPVTGETLLWQTNLGPTTLANSIPNTYDPAVWRYGGTADFNKDGSPDFLWHNIQTGEVIIWKVNGNRIEAFIPTINQLGSTFSIPGEWHIEDISDYTRDGKPDILWRNYRTNQIGVWEMDGFNFSSIKYVSQPISLDWNIEAIADFTGAGSKSLFWKNRRTGDTGIWKIAGEQWINGGWSGTIDLKSRVEDRNWQIVTTGDMNGDRISDVLWQNTATGEASVWYMGSSGFTKFAFLPKPTSGFQIKATGDFNQDGVTDLYLQNKLTGQNQIWYLQQTAAGINYGSTALLPNTLPGNQFLGTGTNFSTNIPTLIWRNTLNQEIVTWQIGPSPADNSTQISALSDPNVQILWTGDLDGTGRSKVLTRNQQNGIVEIGNLNNGIYNKVSNLLPIDRSWAYRGMGDVNGDGIKDIFWQNLETGKVEIWKLGGNDYASVFAPQTVPGAEWGINQVADFNGDGLADIFWRNSRTNQTGIWLMDGSTIKDSGFLATGPVDWQIIKVADFDRNGTADFLWRNTVTGQVVTWLLDGKSIKTTTSLPTVTDSSWSVKSVADFDRDGNSDILWYNGRTKQSVFWKMKDGQFESSVLLPEVPNSAWDLVGTRDFNGDGNLDLLWLNTATGTPTIWYLDKMKYAAVVTLPNLPNPNFKVIGLDDFNQIPA